MEAWKVNRKSLNQLIAIILLVSFIVTIRCLRQPTVPGIKDNGFYSFHERNNKSGLAQGRCHYGLLLYL